jgi:hypothetical protein
VTGVGVFTAERLVMVVGRLWKTIDDVWEFKPLAALALMFSFEGFEAFFVLYAEEFFG